MFDKVKEKAQVAVVKGQNWLRKNKPEICLVGGVVLSGAAIFFAVKEAEKGNEIANETKEKIDELHEKKEEMVKEGKKSEYQKELAKTYIQYGVREVKNFAPTIVCFVGAQACYFTTYKVLDERAGTYFAAWSRANKALKASQDSFPENPDEPQPSVIPNEKANTVTYSSNKIVPGSITVCFCRDTAMKGFSRNPIYTIDYLKMKEGELNDLLPQVKDLYLDYALVNVIGYRFEDTPEGRELKRKAHNFGWHYDPKNPELCNIVKLGIDDLCYTDFDDVPDTMDARYWLSPNCDGDIYHYCMN